MNNSPTVDRRDVAHPTNPIGGNTAIENEDLGRPLDAEADRLSVAGNESSIRGVPEEAGPGKPSEDSHGGLPRGVPPARSGRSAEERESAEVRARSSASGGADRIAPGTGMPQPVTQDIGKTDRTD